MTLDLASPAAMDFGSYLRREGYWFVVPLDDEHYACLCQFAYSCAILKGRWFDRYVHEDRWCYTDAEAATRGMIEWFLADPRPSEPTGWHRHPMSGRRRPDGDATREYINP